jgi:hypothetical protein
VRIDRLALPQGAGSWIAWAVEVREMSAFTDIKSQR